MVLDHALATGRANLDVVGDPVALMRGERNALPTDRANLNRSLWSRLVTECGHLTGGESRSLAGARDDDVVTGCFT